jgi:protease-3
MSLYNSLTLPALCLSIGFIPVAFSASDTSKEPSMNAIEIVESSIIKSPNDPRDYQVIRLSNQLEVLLISDPDLKNSSASLSVPVGSMHNPDSQLGLAHYLEHMLFLGSERYPTINEYSKFMSQNGGYTNAYTSQQSTVYGFEVNDSHFAEALDRLGDVMRAPLLDETYADKERQTVNAEHKTYYDNDMRKLYALQRYTLNPEYPSARFSTGDVTTLVDKDGSKLQDEMVNFFSAYYSANLMKVALTSPRSIADMQKIASTYLQQIPNNNAQKPIVVTPMLTAKELAIEVEMKPTADLKLLHVNFLVPSVKDEYMYQPGGYISRLLGSDHQGGLSDYLQKAGLVDSVMAGFSSVQSDTYSLFSLQFKLTEAGLKQQDTIMATLFSFIELIKTQGITELQYQEQKKNLDTRFEFLNKNSGFNYVMSLSASMQLYPNKDLLYYPYRLVAFNEKFIAELLTYLTPENSRLFKLSPNAQGGTQIPYYQGEYAKNTISKETQQAWLKESKNIDLILPSSNPWSPENLSLVAKEESQQALHLVDKKGHSVWFKQSEYIDEPKAKLKLQLNSNIADQNAKSRVAMSLMLNMLKKEFSELNFQTHEAGLSFSVGSSNGLLISTSGYSDKQDKLLLTVLSEVKNAEFNEQLLKLAKQEMLRQLNNKSKMKPMDLALSGFRQLVRQPAWSDQTLLSEIEAINLQDIQELIDKIFSSSSLRLLALGNLSQDQVLALNTSLQKIVNIQAQPFYVIKRLDADLNQGALNYPISSEMEDDALASIYLSNLKGDKALAQAELLNQLLRPVFYDQIRTQEQLTYSPFTAIFPVNDRVAFGLFTQSPAVSNAKLHARFGAFLDNFNNVLEETSEQQFASIKETHIANYLAKPTNMSAEFSYLSNEWINVKAEIETKQAYIDSLSNTSLADLKVFYHDVLLSGNNAQPILIQVQGEKFRKEALLTVKNEVKITDVDSLPK